MLQSQDILKDQQERKLSKTEAIKELREKIAAAHKEFLVESSIPLEHAYWAQNNALRFLLSE